MNTSVIRQRVADFLKQHPPFESLSEEDLLELAGSGRVRFHESEEYLYRQGEPKGRFVWVVQQGRVELIDESSSGDPLRDVLGEGDLAGLDRFAGDGSYLYSARTASDVILYALAGEVFEGLLPRYPSLKRFLAAHFSVSGAGGFGRTSWLDAEPPPPEFLRSRLVAIPADASIAEATAHLSTADSGVAALVDDGGRLAGIVSAAGLCSTPSGPMVARARSCEATASPITTRKAVREMLSAGAEELAITADGTSNAPVEALLTASDLALFCAWNPMRLVAAIRHARSIGELAALRRQADRMVLDALAQPRDVDDCRLMASEAGTALAGACIRLARTEVLAAGLEPPGASHCWVNFGASVRGDLLATTLPVIAAVYDDSSDRCAPQDSMYFAALVGQTMAAFHACGLSGADIAWPGGSRPSMPLSEWKRLYCETIRNPLGHDLYARREFFDFGPLSGDRAVFARLGEYIAQEFAGHEAVIPLLANDTFANLPPLTFFRGLVLEMDGEQRESFDIAQAAVTPIVAAARVFALAKGRLASSGTLERLKTAALDFPQGAEVFQEAAEAFRIAVYYQSLAGGPRIHPRNLRKFDQLLLKNAFSSVQRLLEFTAATLIPSG